MSLSTPLVVGAGYTGARLARRLAAAAPVTALCAHAETAHAVHSAAITGRVLDLDRDATQNGALADLGAIGPLIYLVPPPPHGDTDPRLERLIAQLPMPPERFVYVSTTGVYGNTDGTSVDEDSPPNPQTARARRRLAAEEQVRGYVRDQRSAFTILRVPGIYGPGRLPLERLRRGDPVLDPCDAGITNRIQVEDLVDALVLCATHSAAANRIYNVTDGHPSSTTEYLETLARLAGLPPPRRIRRADATAHYSTEALSFLDESRRVESRRIREELGFTPLFADLSDGLRASLAAS